MRRSVVCVGSANACVHAPRRWGRTCRQGWRRSRAHACRCRQRRGPAPRRRGRSSCAWLCEFLMHAFTHSGTQARAADVSDSSAGCDVACITTRAPRAFAQPTTYRRWWWHHAGASRRARTAAPRLGCCGCAQLQPVLACRGLLRRYRASFASRIGRRVVSEPSRTPSRRRSACGATL